KRNDDQHCAIDGSSVTRASSITSHMYAELHVCLPGLWSRIRPEPPYDGSGEFSCEVPGMRQRAYRAASHRVFHDHIKEKLIRIRRLLTRFALGIAAPSKANSEPPPPGSGRTANVYVLVLVHPQMGFDSGDPRIDFLDLAQDQVDPGIEFLFQVVEA